MKKSLLFLVLCFPFMKVYALDTTSELTDLQNKINVLNERVKSYEDTRLDKTYPIGSIFETTNYANVADVNNILGGTWEVYGSGRILVGVNNNDSNFNTVDKTGGISTVTLTTTNLPSHTHNIPALSGTAASSGNHYHNVTARNDQSGYGATITANSHYFKFAILTYSGTSSIANQGKMTGVTALNSGAHSHTVTTVANTSGSLGSGTPFSNIQPSIAIYRYKRVA